MNTEQKEEIEDPPEEEPKEPCSNCELEDCKREVCKILSQYFE